MASMRKGPVRTQGGPLAWIRFVVGKIPLIFIVGGLLYGFWILPHGTALGLGSVRGYAEALDTQVAPIAAGKIESIEVMLGQRVKAGDVVARMSTKQLDAHRVNLLAQLDQSLAQIPAQRSLQDADVMRGELWVLRAKAIQNGDRAELKEMSSQVERLNQLAQDHMIPALEAEDRRRLQSAVAARVGAYDQAAEHGQAGLDHHGRIGAGHAASVETRIEPYRHAARAQEAAIEEIDLALQECVLHAPADGVVSVLGHQRGEVIPAGESVVTLVTARPGVVVAGIPERLAKFVSTGMLVSLRRETLLSPRLQGRVIEVAPEIDQTPPRSRLSPGIPVWGRRIAVQLLAPEELLPGEAFYVRF